MLLVYIYGPYRDYICCWFIHMGLIETICCWFMYIWALCRDYVVSLYICVFNILNTRFNWFRLALDSFLVIPIM